MQVVFSCPHCSSTIEADSEISGTRATCPACEEVVLVPAPGVEIGMTIGGYRIERKLGSGGMGEVFEATQLAMERPVAIKILPPALTNESNLVDRFLHEIKTSGKLNHPNIVVAFDAGEADGFYYLAMSFVNGEDLSERLKRHGCLPEAEALAIVDSIAAALDYAWTRHHMLHRDLKPANIMIDADGQVKLMDMGIAKSIKEDSNLTMKGMLVGTPFYMSPEQAMSMQDIDCRADIYSLGATLFHLVTGEKPFDGPNAVAVVAKHVSGDMPIPSEVKPDISPECEAMITRMMARSRDDRFADWKELRRALAPLLGTDATMITPGHSDPTSVLPEEQYQPTVETPSAGSQSPLIWTLLGIAGTLVVAAVVGFFLLTRNPSRDRDSPDRPEHVTNVPDAPPEQPPDEPRANLGPQIAEAIRFGNENLQEWPLVMERFAPLREAAEAARDEGALHEIQARLRDLEGKRIVAIERVREGLLFDAANMSKHHLFTPAAILLEEYSGPYSGETHEDREKHAAQLREAAARFDPIDVRTRDALRMIWGGNSREALEFLKDAERDEAFSKHSQSRRVLTELRMLALNQRPGRPRRQPRLMPQQAKINKAFTMAKHGEYDKALEILDDHDSPVAVILHGEIRARQLRGPEWRSVAIDGEAYTGKVKKLRFRLHDDEKITVTANDSNSMTDHVRCIGDWMIAHLNNRQYAWRIVELKGDELTLEPQPGVTARLTRTQ